nr:MAG TPA: hypothetical protein [Caudoviricetes sp.]
MYDYFCNLKTINQFFSTQNRTFFIHLRLHFNYQ